jgi:hypothetical protein
MAAGNLHKMVGRVGCICGLSVRIWVFDKEESLYRSIIGVIILWCKASSTSYYICKYGNHGRHGNCLIMSA